VIFSLELISPCLCLTLEFQTQDSHQHTNISTVSNIQRRSYSRQQGKTQHELTAFRTGGGVGVGAQGSSQLRLAAAGGLHAGIEVNPWIGERGKLHSVLPGRMHAFAGGSRCLSGGPETLWYRRWLRVQLQPQGNAVRLFPGAQPHGQHTGRRKWLAGLAGCKR
jgi:hypothetical protein